MFVSDIRRPGPTIPAPPHQRRAVGGVRCIAAVAGVYALTLAVLPSDGFWINDNGCKFIQTQSAIRTNYRDFAIPWPGQAADPEFSCNPLPAPFGHIVNARLFGTFSPVFPTLASVPFRWLGYLGLYALPLAGGIVTLAGVWSLTGLLVSSGRARRIAQPLSVGLVGLGTPLWFYSVTFWEHTAAVACVTWAVRACLLARESSSMRQWIVAGCLSALAVWFRDDCYLLAVVLPLVAVCRGPIRAWHVAIFGAAFVLAVAPLWVFQWITLGDPLGFHLRSGSVFEVGLLAHLVDRTAVAARLLFNNHESVWLSALVSLVPLILLLTRPCLRARSYHGAALVLFVLATGSTLVVLAGLLTAQSPIWALRNANGLFAAAPILAVGLVRYGRTRTAPDRPDSVHRVFLTNIVLVYALLYVLLTPKTHAGGIHWGCRYLLPVIPFLGLLASVAIADWWVRFHMRSQMGILLLLSALGVSVVAQGFSLMLLHGRKQYSSTLNRLVREAPQEAVIADGWFVPQALAGNFYEKQIFLAGHPRAAETVVRRLREQGIEEVLSVAWAPEAVPKDASIRVLDDGWLKFMTLQIESVRIAPSGGEP